MAQPFKHDAACLLDFFSQSGRGFFVPYYQRNYSWDEENAAKLIEDIFSSIKRTLTNIPGVDFDLFELCRQLEPISDRLGSDGRRAMFAYIGRRVPNETCGEACLDQVLGNPPSL